MISDLLWNSLGTSQGPLVAPRSPHCRTPNHSDEMDCLFSVNNVCFWRCFCAESSSSAQSPWRCTVLVFVVPSLLSVVRGDVQSDGRCTQAQ